MKTIITFIIPTIGRKTLERTILSLINQNNQNWKAIIIFDGVKNNINQNIDKRISIYEIKKQGKKNMAGLVRNYGINKVNDSDWIGFVDDDDTISKDYIDKLLIESKYQPDVILFRLCQDNLILPPINNDCICKGLVGISFCVKTDILKLIEFKNSHREDYVLLTKLKKKYKILFSKYITYYVRDSPK